MATKAEKVKPEKLEKVSIGAYAETTEQKSGRRLEWQRRLKSLSVTMMDLSLSYSFALPDALGWDIWNIGEEDKQFKEGKVEPGDYYKELNARIEKATQKHEIKRFISGKGAVRNVDFKLIDKEGNLTRCNLPLDVTIKEGNPVWSRFLHMPPYPELGGPSAEGSLTFELYQPATLFNGLWENIIRHPPQKLGLWLYANIFEFEVDAAFREFWMHQELAIEDGGSNHCFINNVSFILPKFPGAASLTDDDDEEEIPTQDEPMPESEKSSMTVRLQLLALSSKHLKSIKWALWLIAIALIIHLSK